MTTLENTISMLKVLPEADLMEIQNFTRKLFQRRSADNCFHSVSAEQIFSDLETSRKQISEGKSKEMGQAIDGIRRKYGL